MFIISSNKNDEIYIAYWEETKWLVLSSYFFIIPSYYAYINKLYLHSIILFLTSVISVNYWKKATYSWRRNMDLIFSKFSFIIVIWFNNLSASEIRINVTDYLFADTPDNREIKMNNIYNR